MNDELLHNLESLQRDECYRVDSVLKNSEYERTERVFFVGSNGAELGPFVRKIFYMADGIGAAWQRVFRAQLDGARFIHFPRITDCYEAGEQFVVVMEFVAGKTFEEIIRTHGNALDVTRSLFLGACDAVSELHESFTPALIHRDIKPSNLMISKNTVILIDLSIARSFNSEAATDTVKFGSRGFAPPEQFGFGQTDVRSDIYGLGMLLFSLLTSEMPEPLSIEQTMRKHNVAPEVCAVVLQATAFDPASRYQTVADLKQAFLLATDKELSVLTNVADTNKKLPRISCKCKRHILHEGRFATAGIVWDAILAAASALMFVFCSLTHFFPNSELASINPLARGIQLIGIWVLFSSPVLTLCDPRPLAQLFPRFSALSFTKRLVIAVVVALVSFVIVGVAHNMS